MSLSEESDRIIRAELSALYDELSQLDEKFAVSLAKGYVEMAKMNRLAKAGYRPSFPLIQYGVYDVEFSPVVGSEQGLRRPAILWWVSSKNARNALAIPLTTKAWGDHLSFHIDLVTEMNEKSTAKLHQIRSIDKARIIRPVTRKHKIVRLEEVDITNIRNRLRTFLKLDEQLDR